MPATEVLLSAHCQVTVGSFTESVALNKAKVPIHSESGALSPAKGLLGTVTSTVCSNESIHPKAVYTVSLVVYFPDVL